MSGNLRAALEQYDAQQRRQAALLEAQRIGNLIHIQEQQLVAAKHLAKQRANAYRQRQQLQQHLLQQQLLEQQQLQQAQLEAASRPVQQALAPLPELAECAIDDEEESPLPSPRALQSSSASASLAASSSHSQEDQTEVSDEPASAHTLTGVCMTRPAKGEYAYLSHSRRPRECDAILCARNEWKADHLSVSCDNIRCPVQFSLLRERRHHCRLCGNIFCAACLPHKEVLHDMSKLPWNYMPEMFIASLFPPPELKQEAISAPSTPTLSSSYESGSSRASQSDSFHSSRASECSSTSTGSASTLPRLYSGTDKQIEWPIPEYLREIAIENATEHKICTDCHARIHDLPIPSDVFEERVALTEIREEIAWSMWLLGLDRWDQTLRNHGLTLKPSPATRRRSKLTRRESVMSSSTEATDASHFTSLSAASEISEGAATQTSCGASQSSQSDSSSQSRQQQQQTRSTAVSAPPAPTTDACERPLDFERFAWPTAPSFIRFTARALEPPPAAAPQPEPIPSAFGARKSPARYLYPIRPPVEPVEPPKPTEEEIEADRQARYEAALTEYKREAYDLAYARPCFRRAYSLPTSRDCEENWVQNCSESLSKWWRSSTPPPPFVVSGDYGWEDKARHEARRLAAHRASWLATSKRWARFAYTGVWTTPEDELIVVLE